MKRVCSFIAACVLAIGLPTAVNAQYWQLANQATNMISTALTGGAAYKGYVETSYMKGIGENNGDFLGVSTSHGLMYGSHFFMGLGFGVDALFAHVDEDNSWISSPLPTLDKSTTKTGCVLPIFSDFRAIIGPQGKPQFQIGLKMGCSFLVSNNYITVNRGYITSSECFYLKPSLGIRIPVSKTKVKQAVTASVAYQLITPNYRPYYATNTKSISLNSFGLIVGFEW